MPGGRALVTLRDAGEHIRSLSKAEQEKPHWQAATEALLLVVNSKTGPTMLARMGMMQALRHGLPPEPAGPRRKRAKRYKVIR